MLYSNGWKSFCGNLGSTKGIHEYETEGKGYALKVVIQEVVHIWTQHEIRNNARSCIETVHMGWMGSFRFRFSLYRKVKWPPHVKHGELVTMA